MARPIDYPYHMTHQEIADQLGISPGKGSPVRGQRYQEAPQAYGPTPVLSGPR